MIITIHEAINIFSIGFFDVADLITHLYLKFINSKCGIKYERRRFVEILKIRITAYLLSIQTRILDSSA